ncbi:MAG TPA: SseB family protein [Streptosporangiaceae bacterium]|nr:SseB family protein [Streptosporangiaceae bacterium]
MPEITGGDPAFRSDDGTADPAVTAALDAFAAGECGETAALAALAVSRLLVPVVAVAADLLDQDEAERRAGERTGEKATEMAMPTLIGLDGRRAVPAFTCLESMRRWQPGARPVPVAAAHVWQAAAGDGCAVVVDVGGPVPIAVEGARLDALARGEPAPAPCCDPDVHDIVAGVLSGELAIAGFELHPGDADRDLTIALTLAPGSAGRDVTELAAQVGAEVMERLGARLRRGVAIWLGVPGQPGR